MAEVATLVNATGQVDEKKWRAAVEKTKKTGSLTHRAIQRGYAVDPNSAAGVIVEEGEMIPAGIAISDVWMERVKGVDSALERAVEEALDLKPKDTDLNALSKAALEAMAAERGINVTGLSKADLITAITAKRETDAG